MVRRTGLASRRVPIADDTRTSLTIHERSTGKEFRFVPEGPSISAAELDAFEAAAKGECDLLVASGSLPPCVPETFYAGLAKSARQQGARFVLDTSGPELRAALDAGGIFLVKASKEELNLAAARAIVAAGEAEIVALTLGSEGALLVTPTRVLALASHKIQPVSTVGAGDSFLGGMIHRLAGGAALEDAFRTAVAAGAAATLSPGTDLAHAADVERLLQQIPQPAEL
jgi:6-phosphofructokinase 2